MLISISLVLLGVSSTIAATLPATDLETSRVVNGFEIDIEDIPYHAALRRKVTSGGWAYICGGSIISDRAVLTAAHCAVRWEPSDLRVSLGSSFRLSGGKVFELSKIIVHEAYSSEYLVNDIAMLFTSRRITFGRGINSINYAPPDLKLYDGTEALVSGFGLTEYSGSASSTLQAAQVYIVEQDACAQAYRKITFLSPGMICASATNPSRDACQGDSGGPLVAEGYLVGIVSWGEGCANPLYPGVYTRVSEYYYWISSHKNNEYYSGD